MPYTPPPPPVSAEVRYSDASNITEQDALLQKCVDTFRRDINAARTSLGALNNEENIVKAVNQGVENLATNDDCKGSIQGIAEGAKNSLTNAPIDLSKLDGNIQNAIQDAMKAILAKSQGTDEQKKIITGAVVFEINEQKQREIENEEKLYQQMHPITPDATPGKNQTGNRGKTGNQL